MVRRTVARCNGHPHNGRNVRTGGAVGQRIATVAELSQRTGRLFEISASGQQGVDGKRRVAAIRLEGRGTGRENVEDAVLERG